MANIGGIWQAARKVLGILTDLLTVGRSAGWWDKSGGPPTGRAGDEPPK